MMSSTPRYWVPRLAVYKAFERSKLLNNHAIVIREITNSTNERTIISCIIPRVGMGHTCWTVRLGKVKPRQSTFFVANLNAFVLDYAARQKVGGTHMSNFILKQLPIFSPSRYENECQWEKSARLGDWLFLRVLELTYTDWTLELFSKDCDYNGPPFRWNDARRFLLRSELDAAYFHLYGIIRDDVDYIMETFPIVKRNDTKQHGDYRTKLMILDIYDRMQQAMDTGEPYQTLLDPTPADPRVAHPPRTEA
jgi:hypothetical protein